MVTEVIRTKKDDKLIWEFAGYSKNDRRIKLCSRITQMTLNDALAWFDLKNGKLSGVCHEGQGLSLISPTEVYLIKNEHELLASPLPESPTAVPLEYVGQERESKFGLGLYLGLPINTFVHWMGMMAAPL